MLANNSFQRFDVIPAAILFDGVVPVPLYAVTQMTLTETYHLPPIGSAGARAIVSTHDDTIQLTASLVGPTRFAMKAVLEAIAESSKRGTKALATALVGIKPPRMNGLVLVTAMTIRTDMQVQSMTFSATVNRRQTLDLQMTLAYMPNPGIVGKLLDLGSIAVGALADMGN